MIEAHDLLDSSEVADLLGTSQASITVAMSNPEISPRVARILPVPLRKVGGSWVWRRSEVEAAIRREDIRPDGDLPWTSEQRRGDGRVERICVHGIGHPTPETIAAYDGIHGCDGCCTTIAWRAAQ